MTPALGGSPGNELGYRAAIHEQVVDDTAITGANDYGWAQIGEDAPVQAIGYSIAVTVRHLPAEGSI